MIFNCEVDKCVEKKKIVINFLTQSLWTFVYVTDAYYRYMYIAVIYLLEKAYYRNNWLRQKVEEKKESGRRKAYTIRASLYIIRQCIVWTLKAQFRFSTFDISDIFGSFLLTQFILKKFVLFRWRVAFAAVKFYGISAITKKSKFSDLRDV